MRPFGPLDLSFAPFGRSGQVTYASYILLDVEALPCTPAAAAPIESMIKNRYILLMGAAAAGADKGSMGLGCVYLIIGHNWEKFGSAVSKYSGNLICQPKT